MSLVGLLAALGLPAAIGTLVWILLLGRPRTVSAVCAAVGSGYLAGCIGFGTFLRLFDGAEVASLFGLLAPWLGVVAAMLAVVAWRYGAAAQEVASAPASPRERLAIAGLWMLVAVAFVLILQQATALPTLTWDAWNAWLAKSKAWYHFGAFVPVLDTQAWLEAPAGSAIGTTAPGYPQALSRFAVWLASASGGWNEPAIHSAWPLAWLATGLACFGCLGISGVRTLPASIASTGLLTLPLFTAHASLAGYADVWQAALVMLAASLLARAFVLRSRRAALMALLLAALCVGVKLEGAVWMACLGGAALMVWLPPRWRLAALALPVLVVLWVGLVGAIRLPVPGLGLVRFEWGALELPVIGRMALAWRPVLDEFALTLWLLPNWSLLWYVAPLVLAMRWRRLAQSPDVALLGAFVASGAAFLFVLFFFTDAAVWAQNYTSINRVLMQLVPTVVLWLTLLWTPPAPSGTANSTPR